MGVRVKTPWMAAACGLVLSVAIANAQGSATDTVTIGKEKKTTVGRVTGLNAGDVACYVTLTDDKGREFDEMAEFEICERQSLVGKRVRLTYGLEKVLADECQGDPDCKKTKTVALIKKIAVLPGTAPASAPAAAAPAAAPAATRQESFCTPLETVVFACWTGKKLVSVCAADATAPGRGYVQYRFGNPDSPAGMELAFPEGGVAPAKAATGATIPYAGGGAAWMRFPRGEYAYVLFTGIGKWGPRRETLDYAGVTVERNGKRVSNLLCSGPYQSELGPDWFERVGITGEPDAFELPEPPTKK